MLNSFKKNLVQSIPDINDFCIQKITDSPNNKSLRIELEPIGEFGQEVICLSGYDNNITLSYDYYERNYDIHKESFEETFKAVIDIVRKILIEQLVAVTTDHNINTSRESILLELIEAKKIKRENKFRARSWAGTYNEDYP